MLIMKSRVGCFPHKIFYSLLAAGLVAMTATSAFAGEGKSGAAKPVAASAVCASGFSGYKTNIWATTAPPNAEADSVSTVYPPSDDYKVLGGGAIIHTLDGYSFLTGSYPDIANGVAVGWIAQSKHQGSGTRARLTAYAITVYDPDDCWNVKVYQQSTTSPVAHPAATVTIDAGYALTGGGALAVPQTAGGNGNFLYSSMPYAGGGGSTYNGWSVHSKDHGFTDVANITAYAIGIKAAGAGVVTPTSNVVAGKASASLSNPSASVTGYNNVLPGVNCVLTGGGAHDDWGNGWGNLLTAIFPLGNGGWQSFGQSYGPESPATLKAYAVCLN
ncbi:MAG: hypothetical protein ACOY33_02875 [Pseudomonadota bacterium]